MALALLVGLSGLSSAASHAEEVSLVLEEQPSWVLLRVAMTGTSGTLIVRLSQPSGAYMHAGFYDEQLRWTFTAQGVEGYQGTRMSIQGEDLVSHVVKKDKTFELHILLSPQTLNGDILHLLLGASGDFASWSASLEVEGDITLVERVAEGTGAYYLTYHDLASPTSVSASYRGAGAMAIINGTWSTRLHGAAVGTVQFYWSTWADASEFTNVIHERDDVAERYDCPCSFLELHDPGSLNGGTLRIDATRATVVERNTWEWTAAAFFDVVLPENLVAPQ